MKLYKFMNIINFIFGILILNELQIIIIYIVIINIYY